MMWFDKKDERCLFLDKRDEDYCCPPDAAHPSGTTVSIRPDCVEDFTCLSCNDEEFWHVVFDPPHVIRKQELGTVTKKYGVLPSEWRDMLRAGFSECFRILKPGGTLIFKWCEVTIPLRDVLALTPHKPLYGHRSGVKAQTHWVAFIKMPQ